MAKTPERIVKDAIRKKLDGLGFWRAGGSKPPEVRGWYHMPVPSPLSVHGIPDYECCYRGWFFGIEAKKPKGVRTYNQEKRAEEIEAAGGVVIVVAGVDELHKIDDALRRLDARLSWAA